MTSYSSRLAIGTAQFGLDYGATNAVGQVPALEVRAILDAAKAAGITTLDTAAAYGEAERVLGSLGEASTGFRIITKTLPCRGPEIENSDILAIEGAIARSCAKLGRPSLDVLLCHHGVSLLWPGGQQLLELLQDVKAAGLARSIGVSVYDPTELEAILHRFTPDLVQLPFNLLDQRFLQSGLLARLAGLGVEVHARSLFLQGTLLAHPEALPEHLRHLAAPIGRIAAFAQDHGLTQLEACLGFGLAQPEIGALVVGVTSVAELKALLAAAADVSRHPYPDSRALAVVDPGLINPSRWPVTS